MAPGIAETGSRPLKANGHLWPMYCDRRPAAPMREYSQRNTCESNSRIDRASYSN